MVQPWYNCGYC